MAENAIKPVRVSSPIQEEDVFLIRQVLQLVKPTDGSSECDEIMGIGIGGLDFQILREGNDVPTLLIRKGGLVCFSSHRDAVVPAPIAAEVHQALRAFCDHLYSAFPQIQERCDRSG